MCIYSPPRVHERGTLGLPRSDTVQKDRYVLFSDINAAADFVALLDAARGATDVWDLPTEHPFDDRALIAWCDGYLEAYAYMLVGRDTITPEEARSQGWHFHPIFKGSFAKARLKLEEAQFILDGLKLAQTQPNFPAYSALYYSFLSALYSVKEALRKTCEKLGNEEKQWWEGQFQKLKGDPIVNYFYNLNNDQKHGVNSSPLRVDAKIYEVTLPAFPGQVMMSAEGAFGIVYAGTARERRIHLTGLDSRMTVQLLAGDGSVLGDAVSLSEGVLRFYEDMTFDARQQFDKSR